MNDDQLLQYVRTAEIDTVRHDSSIDSDHRKAFNYYSLGDMGNEVEGQSRVKSTDVFDLVESDMPSHIRTFLGHNDIMEFKPENGSDTAKREAQEKTDYINYLIKSQPGSYMTGFSWLKGGEIYRFSPVTFGYEEKETETTKEFKNVTEDEAEEIKIAVNLQVEAGAEIEWQDIDQPEGEEVSLKVSIKKTSGSYYVRWIQPDRFVISDNAISVSDSEIVGHDEYLRKYELVQLGYSVDLVKDLPTTTETDNQSGTLNQGNSIDWTGEIVLVEYRYIRVDDDGDGIPELIKVTIAGDKIIEREEVEIFPYAVFSATPLPGQMIGLSRADAVIETQDIKTALLRQTINNMYQVNSARMAVNGRVNKDDLLTTRLNGIVRVKGEGSPLEAIAPLPVPFIGDKALAVLQYADSARAQRTGSLMANQALDVDKLHKETATRFKGVETAATAKIELLQRNFAETGYRELFEGLLWTVMHYQDTSAEILKLGKQITVSPHKWMTSSNLVSCIGLANGDEDTQLENMASLLALHQQLLATGSPITDQKKVYNIGRRIIKSMNLPEVEEFFNNPEVPEETLQAQVEALQLQNQQLSQIVEQSANPLAEAEKIKQQALLIKAEADQQINIAKLAEDQRQFNATMLQNQQQFMAELQESYTELELKHGTDIKGKGVE